MSISGKILVVLCKSQGIFGGRVELFQILLRRGKCKDLHKCKERGYFTYEVNVALGLWGLV